ncbi:hypothetical protein NEFER03_1552 [Nematocida sp. LUAm3]|nr:hypothetical protein NEFER03_1552 [Nematocida sp. LUAm3]KAI5174585.1 hypothetical protein NEFER02_0706 [Nematocida sp. LUAm2]KAI5178009.1 hypothetical protein NEFER01_1191 [Nematocida sp. LUAm1]
MKISGKYHNECKENALQPTHKTEKDAASKEKRVTESFRRKNVRNILENSQYENNLEYAIFSLLLYFACSTMILVISSLLLFDSTFISTGFSFIDIKQIEIITKSKVFIYSFWTISTSVFVYYLMLGLTVRDKYPILYHIKRLFGGICIIFILLPIFSGLSLLAISISTVIVFYIFSFCTPIAIIVVLILFIIFLFLSLFFMWNDVFSVRKHRRNYLWYIKRSLLFFMTFIFFNLIAISCVATFVTIFNIRFNELDYFSKK